MNGVFFCQNAACAEAGTLMELIKHSTGRNDFEALRLISKLKTESAEPFQDRMKKILEPVGELPEFNNTVLDRMYDEFWRNERPQEYMRQDRGFYDETLREFRIGYSTKQDMVGVPMHDIGGKPIGLIGRSIADKAFKNSVRLPTSKTLWNVHRARRAGDVAVICEASFDAMRIHQAGYPNVVACLGGNFSAYHAEQLERNFSGIVIMTDFDNKERHRYANCKKCAKVGIYECVGHNPGRSLGETIAENMRRKSVRWASFDSGMVYPPGVKDAGDMTDEQIRRCIQNAVSNFEYHTWSIET